MKHAALALIIALPGCAALQKDGPRAIESAVCVLADDQLSIAFKNPAAARAYVEKLSDRIAGGDREAAMEAADRLMDIVGCIK